MGAIDMNGLDPYLKSRRSQIDDAITKILDSCEWDPPVLRECVDYTLFGGKRLRSIILLAACESQGGNTDLAIPFGAGLEMIHAYSLVHDDLPCMDDDDYRRGKLTCHKKFGEALAVLCGDALLTMAFEIMLSPGNTSDDVKCNAAREIAAAAGPRGMVGGQVLDLLFEGKHADAEQVMKMYYMKTAALFEVSARVGAMLAQASQDSLEGLSSWGRHFGYAFQIIDDLEDIGENEKEEDKSTLIDALSFEGACKEARKALIGSLDCLFSLDLSDSFFVDLSRLYMNRLDLLSLSRDG